MCHYKHLTPFERERILFFLIRGESITKIARLLNRSKSTISREIRRNAASADSSMPYYLPFEAQMLYVQRRKACRPHKRLDDASLRAYVQTCILKFHWSPEEIAGRIQLEYDHSMISVTTIYRAIHSGILNPDGTSPKYVLRKLRHHGKRRHKKGTKECRGKFVISHAIEERPASAENRSVCGHWEADTVVGKQGKACLVTLVDRKSRYLLGGKAERKTAAAVNQVMGESLWGQPHLSVTPDRGKEFSKHVQLSDELDQVPFYFPAPHQPWKRGTNENTNGLLREYFQKGKDITNIPEEYIQRKFHELNLRPRKCLGYKTPYEVYFSKVLHLA